uniref:Uncharacterized protein n=1 Tax=Arundo donax TaxID=35708 RepID=A0A0A9CIT4_ARUDO
MHNMLISMLDEIWCGLIMNWVVQLVLHPC